MSRDQFSPDPRSAAEAAETRFVRQRVSTPDMTISRNPVSGTLGRSETIDPREPRLGHHGPSDSLRAYYVRDRTYLLRDSEFHSLTEIGKFRLIAAPDLHRYAYGEDSQQMERDVRRLSRQGLISDETLAISHKKTLRVLTLTKAGHRLLKCAKQIPDDQEIYHGLKKPRDARHDSDLYRVYQTEAARIESSGGKPLRILLDYELMKNLNGDLASLEADENNSDRKQEIAQKHDLRLVNGKIPVPDLRVEYETAECEVRHVDLELATREYRPRALAEKAAAGFSLYSRAEDASRLRRILHARKLTAVIRDL
jgi:hypothetical protein